MCPFFISGGQNGLKVEIMATDSIFIYFFLFVIVLVVVIFIIYCLREIFNSLRSSLKEKNISIKTETIKVLKYILLMVIGSILFYFLCPKYHFMLNGQIRCNTITGQVQILQNGRWQPFQSQR